MLRRRCRGGQAGEGFNRRAECLDEWSWLCSEKNKHLAQKLETQGWRSDDEREQQLQQLQGSKVKAADIIPLLWNRDAAVRAAAAGLFSKRADVRAVAALLETLQSESSQRRSFAMRMLGRMNPAPVEGAVERALASEDTSQRRLGWEVALTIQGDGRQRSLERVLQDGPLALRRTALQRLLAEHPVEALVPLLLGQRRGSNERLRARSVEALCQVRSPEVFSAMVERFQQEVGIVREMAGAYLRETATQDPEAVRHEVLHMLSQGDDATRHLSVEILMATGEPIEVLLEVFFFCRGLAPWLRQRIFDTLRTSERGADPPGGRAAQAGGRAGHIHGCPGARRRGRPRPGRAAGGRDRWGHRPQRRAGAGAADRQAAREDPRGRGQRPAPVAERAALRPQARLEARGELDYCYAVDEVGCYRVNAYRTRNGLEASFRVIPNVAPTFGAADARPAC